MQEQYKNCTIRYRETTNKWEIDQFEDEEFSSMAEAKKYVDEQGKSKFKRFTALSDGRLGDVTSMGTHGRCWFTPSIAEGESRGWGDRRGLRGIDSVYPVKENQAAIDKWRELEAKLLAAQDVISQIREEQVKVVGTMKPYSELVPKGEL